MAVSLELLQEKDGSWYLTFHGAEWSLETRLGEPVHTLRHKEGTAYIFRPPRADIMHLKVGCEVALSDLPVRTPDSDGSRLPDGWSHLLRPDGREADKK